MKRNILIMAAFIMALGTSGKLNTAFADESYGPGCISTEIGINNQEIRLSDYMKTVYTVTQCPELDESVYKAFDKFEHNKNSSSMLTVYNGTLTECNKFRDYFNLNYGYTNNLRLTTATSQGTYFVVFMDTLNADNRISEYLTEVKKAQILARDLAGSSCDETINNIIKWIRDHIDYYDDEVLTTSVCIAHYYGAYSLHDVVCEGYAMTVYQLCAMNGISSSLVDLVSPSGVLHAVNRVSFSDKIRWVDTLRKHSISDSLWNEYTCLN